MAVRREIAIATALVLIWGAGVAALAVLAGSLFHPAAAIAVGLLLIWATGVAIFEVAR